MTVSIFVTENREKKNRLNNTALWLAYDACKPWPILLWGKKNFVQSTVFGIDTKKTICATLFDCMFKHKISHFSFTIQIKKKTFQS